MDLSPAGPVQGPGAYRQQGTQRKQSRDEQPQQQTPPQHHLRIGQPGLFLQYSEEMVHSSEGDSPGTSGFHLQPHSRRGAEQSFPQAQTSGGATEEGTPTLPAFTTQALQLQQQLLQLPTMQQQHSKSGMELSKALQALVSAPRQSALPAHTSPPSGSFRTPAATKMSVLSPETGAPQGGSGDGGRVSSGSVKPPHTPHMPKQQPAHARQATPTSTVARFSEVTLETLRAAQALVWDFASGGHEAPSTARMRSPRNLCLALAADTGRLAELLAWRDDALAAEALLGAQPMAARGSLAATAGAALLHLVALADVCGFDLSRAALDVLQGAQQQRPPQRPTPRYRAQEHPINIEDEPGQRTQLQALREQHDAVAALLRHTLGSRGPGTGLPSDVEYELQRKGEEDGDGDEEAAEFEQDEEEEEGAGGEPGQKHKPSPSMHQGQVEHWTSPGATARWTPASRASASDADAAALGKRKRFTAAQIGALTAVATATGWSYLALSPGERTRVCAAAGISKERLHNFFNNRKPKDLKKPRPPSRHGFTPFGTTTDVSASGTAAPSTSAVEGSSPVGTEPSPSNMLPSGDSPRRNSPNHDPGGDSQPSGTQAGGDDTHTAECGGSQGCGTDYADNGAEVAHESGESGNSGNGRTAFHSEHNSKENGPAATGTSNASAVPPPEEAAAVAQGQKVQANAGDGAHNQKDVSVAISNDSHRSELLGAYDRVLDLRREDTKRKALGTQV